MSIRSLLCVVFCISAAIGQTFQVPSNDHYIGKGEGASLDVARARAYANMVEQIQVLVSSALRTSTTGTNSSIQHSADQSTLSFSSIVLRDVQELRRFTCSHHSVY